MADMEKKNPGRVSHRSPHDRTQIAIAPDPPRRRRALAKRNSCIPTKPTQARRLESVRCPRELLSYRGIHTDARAKPSSIGKFRCAHHYWRSCVARFTRDPLAVGLVRPGGERDAQEHPDYESTEHQYCDPDVEADHAVLRTEEKNRPLEDWRGGLYPIDVGLPRSRRSISP